MVPPDGWHDADRWFLARSPITRYVSMYEYLRAPHNYSKFGAREVQGRYWGGIGKPGMRSDYAFEDPMNFREFMRFLAYSREAYTARRWVRRRGPLDSPYAWRSPWIWLDPLDKQREVFLRPAWTLLRGWGDLRLETLWDDLDALMLRYGLDGEVSTKRSIHANKTLTYSGEGVERYMHYYSGTCLWYALERGAGVRWADEHRCGTCAACALDVVGECARLGYDRLLLPSV
jgi:hypothetical protein